MDSYQLDEYLKPYCNWGRWGPEDELGTFNFIDPPKIVEACQLVTKGKVFSLAMPFDMDCSQIPREGSRRFNPIHTMLRSGTDLAGMDPDDLPPIYTTDDMITMPLQVSTQWDAFAHVLYRGKMYNNVPYSMIDSEGAKKNSIDKVSKNMIGRGVLLDIPRFRGVPWLQPGDPVESKELQECADSQDVEIRRGDFLLIRTGHIALCRDRGSWGDFAGGRRPGITVETIPWIFQKEITAIACDNYGVEAIPSGVDDVVTPVHLATLANMGLTLGEIFDLDEIAEDCASDNVYEFLFVAPPIPVTRAVGSPVNPYAIK